MARRILDFDGTVVAAGGAYPFGDIKDNPSGTRINRKSNADIQQFFQKLMNSAGITANSLADNDTNGYQLTEALSKVIGIHAGQIVRMLIGGTYDPTKVYILWGCETRSAGGYCYYDGEIYGIQGNAGVLCGGGLVDVLTFFSPTLYTNGVQTLQLVCAASGSGIANFSDFVYVGSWNQTGLIGSNFTAGVGGSFSVDNADIVYAKYLQITKTITVQVNLEQTSITSSPATLNMAMPFLPSNISNTALQVGAVYIPSGGTAEPCVVQFQIAPNLMLIYPPASGWVSGTNNSFISINVVFEID